MTAEMGSLLKADPAACPCGCDKIGRPRVKAWRDGLHHNKNCVCARCMAPLYRRRAAQRERRIAADTGGTREPLSGALSGADVVGPYVEVEETASVAVTRGIRRWWESKGTSAKVGRLMARNSGVPKALILSWPGRRLVVMTYEDWRDLCQQRVKADR